MATGPVLDVQQHTLARSAVLLVKLPQNLLASLLICQQNVSETGAVISSGHMSYLVAEPSMSKRAATAPQQRPTNVCRNLAAVMAGRATKVPWGAGLVVVQGCEELTLARAAESLVPEGQRVILTAGSSLSELAKTLQIVVADLCAGRHEQGAEDDDPVFQVRLGPLIVCGRFKVAVLLHEVVAVAGIEPRTDRGQGRKFLVDEREGLRGRKRVGALVEKV
jgi:hypothetical protein